MGGTGKFPHNKLGEKTRTTMSLCKRICDVKKIVFPASLARALGSLEMIFDHVF